MVQLYNKSSHLALWFYRETTHKGGEKNTNTQSFVAKLFLFPLRLWICIKKPSKSNSHFLTTWNNDFKRQNWLLRNASSQAIGDKNCERSSGTLIRIGKQRSKLENLPLFLHKLPVWTVILQKSIYFFSFIGRRKTLTFVVWVFGFFFPPISYKTSVFYRSSYAPEMSLEFKNGSWMQPQSLGLWHLDTTYRSPSPEKRATASLWSSWMPEGLLCFHGKGHQTTTWSLLYQILSSLYLRIFRGNSVQKRRKKRLLNVLRIWIFF